MKKFLLITFLGLVGILSTHAATDGYTYGNKNGISCTNIWLKAIYHNVEGLAELPWMIDSSIYRKPRTATFGQYNGKHVVLLAYSKTLTVDDASDDYAHIIIIDAFTGEVLTTQQLTCDGAPIKGLLCASQIGVDNFGHTWFMGYISAIYSSETGKRAANLYNVNLETGECTIAAALEVDDAAAALIGDGATRIDYWDLVGDITLEKAGCNIMAAIANGSSTWVLAWTAQMGGTAWTGGLEGEIAKEMDATFPAGVAYWGTAPMVRIVRDDEYSNKLFFVDGFTTTANLYQPSGAMIDGFGSLIDSENVELIPATGTNGICEFSLAGKNFIAYPVNQYVSPGFCAVNICELGPNMEFSAMDYYWTIPEDGLGNVGDGGLRVHSVATKKFVDGKGKEALILLTYKAANGIGVYLIAEDGFDASTILPEENPIAYDQIFNKNLGDKIDIAPGESIQMEPAAHNFNSATGLQFDMTLPQGLSLKEVTVAGVDGERDALKSSYARLSNGDYRVLIYTMDASELDRINLGFSFDADQTLTRSQLVCHNVILSINGRQVNRPEEIVPVRGYKVIIEDIVLDERETIVLKRPIPTFDDVSYTWGEVTPSNIATLSKAGVLTAVEQGTGVYSLTVKDSKFGNVKYYGNLEVIHILWGDVDGDGVLDVTDLVTMIEYILEQGDPESFDEHIADMDGNGEINIVDITALIKLILEQQSSANAMRVRALEDDADAGIADLRFTEPVELSDNTYSISLRVTPTTPYTAMQVDVLIPEGHSLVSVKQGENMKDHTMAYSVSTENVLRVMLYSMSLAELNAAEETDVMTLVIEGPVNNGDIISADNSLAVDTDINSYPLARTQMNIGHKDGVENVSADGCRIVVTEGGIELVSANNTDVTISDMCGRILTKCVSPATVALDKGVYLVSFDGRTPVKVLVR